MKQFKRSKVANMVKHRGGTYYAVTKVQGKVRRRSLETDDFNLAKARLPAVLTELRGATDSAKAGTLAQALTDEANRDDPNTKPATQRYYQQLAAKLIRVSDALPDKPADKHLSKIGTADLRSLVDELAKESSATRYNGALALLRRVYAQAIEKNQAAADPAAPLKRIQPKKTKHDLPTVEDFAAVVADIEGQKKRHSRSTSATVRFLAATGLRISEANALTWGDVKDGALVIRTAKNDDMRRVPLTDTAKAVLSELRDVLPTGATDPVLPIKSPRIALANSCERLGIRHLRVHDLRHIFATRCLEAGVDFPTLALWLGHKDGGVLAAQVYGHISQHHSDEQIKRVRI